MKKREFNFSGFAALMLVAIFALSITSCSDEATDVVGCTDPLALNYDSTAVVSGDCTYAEDKFYGDYLGSLATSVYPSLNSDSIVFSIGDDVASENDNVTLTVTIAGVGVPFPATIDGNVLTIDGTQSFPYFCDATTEAVTLNVTGGGTLSDDEMSIDATLDVTATSGSGGIGCEDDTWSLSGTKQ